MEPMTVRGGITRAEWEALPDDGQRHEVIDGMLLVSPSPSLAHQRVLGALYRAPVSYTHLDVYKRQGYTYHFGDGTSFGPTPDPGGTYPNGGITHPYAKAGAYAVRIDATLGAEFRIEGGPWTRIRDTATVGGIPTSMSVKTARAVLVNQ